MIVIVKKILRIVEKTSISIHCRHFHGKTLKSIHCRHFHEKTLKSIHCRYFHDKTSNSIHLRFSLQNIKIVTKHQNRYKTSKS